MSRKIVKSKEQQIKETAIKYGYSGLFRTPANMNEIQEWIELHSSEEKLHLYTAMQMTANFYAGLIAEMKCSE